MSKRICLDFDGVIHSYASGWCGTSNIPDAPVSDSFDFIQKCLDNGYRVAVFSSRSGHSEGIEAMQRWFIDHGFNKISLKHVEFPREKPPSHIYVDDRGFHFKGIFPTLEFIEKFKPWNQKEN